jgi:hypothetical protein
MVEEALRRDLVDNNQSASHHETKKPPNRFAQRNRKQEKKKTATGSPRKCATITRFDTDRASMESGLPDWNFWHELGPPPPRVKFPGVESPPLYRHLLECRP